ncbi:MAG: hypothetical protein HMLIMOIP_000607 [Candidatus Nitrosomirales archaeon]|jgi:hypothetical protein
MMKLILVSIVLGIMLLTSAIGIGTSYAATGITIVAKEKQGMILLLVKNGQSVNINGLKLTLSDGEITKVKANQNWVSEQIDSKTITLTTDNSPIKSRDQAVFFIGTNNKNTIITWSAQDRFGSTIQTDSTRTIYRQTLEKAPDVAELNYVSNARSLVVTTDKIFYNKSDKIFISGVLDPNTDVLLTIYAPNGQKIKITDETDYTGKFSVLHVLYNADSGTYRLKVRQADGYAETTFRVM